VSFPIGGSISVGSRGFYFRAFEHVKQTKRKFTISRNANQIFLKKGRDLDLHYMYKEVSGCGRLQMVIKEIKWKEIALALDFPPTTTSASFVLRKFYSSFLHHYEQVYLFGVKGHLVPLPTPPANPCPTAHFSDVEHM